MVLTIFSHFYAGKLFFSLCVSFHVQVPSVNGALQQSNSNPNLVGYEASRARPVSLPDAFYQQAAAAAGAGAADARHQEVIAREQFLAKSKSSTRHIDWSAYTRVTSCCFANWLL